MSAVTGIDLACEGLRFAYAEGERTIPAIRDVSLELAAGTSTALLGPSGSGKSTLLLLLRGLLEADAGAVRLDGAGPGEARYAPLQRAVGLVFQQAERQLFAASAREDVAFGPRQLGWAEPEVESAVTEALARVGLPAERFAERHPYSLSGGEQRRLALAGVLAMRPRALMLDEPFVSLDPGARRELADVLTGLREAGLTLLLATHDVDQAWALCERRVLLAGGQVLADGAWRFGEGGEESLVDHALRVPTLVELWRRLGRPAVEAPRTPSAAAEALS